MRFAIQKAIGKQASLTKILLIRIFAVFSKILTQLAAQIQKDEENYNNDNDDNDDDNRNNNINYRTVTRLRIKILQTFNRFPKHKK